MIDLSNLETDDIAGALGLRDLEILALEKRLAALTVPEPEPAAASTVVDLEAYRAAATEAEDAPPGA